MRKVIVCITLLSSSILFSQVNDSINKVTTTFKFGGYAKADYLYSIYNNGDVADGSPLRDIHLPSQIPVGDIDKNIDGDFHVKESRLNFDISSDKFKKPIKGFIEMDFLLSSQVTKELAIHLIQGCVIFILNMEIYYSVKPGLIL